MHNLWRILKESRSFILIATLIFFFGSFSGYMFTDQTQELIDLMMEQLQGAVESITEVDDPLYTTWFIFQNNVRAALIMMVVGIFLFFMPAMMLFTNGLLVGYILHPDQMSALSEAGVEVSAMQMFVYGLLPHGILELPAIFIAGGVGIFYGWRVLVWLFGGGGFFAHLIGGNRSKTIRGFWREDTFPIFKSRVKSFLALSIALIVVLLVAAFVESYITPVLLGSLLGE